MKNKEIISREIISLDDFEHVRLKPTMWVGSVIESEEKVPIIRNKRIVNETKDISLGFYKLFDEILDNAIDEAKRCVSFKKPMSKIEVDLDVDNNRISIRDYGQGFYKGSEINSKTGITNIETAVSELKSGSNFKNDGIEENIIGTNGVGSALVNILSDEFEIETINNKTYFYSKWVNYEQSEKTSKKKRKSDKKGTKISFIPTKDIFNDIKWDKDILFTKLCFKKFLLNNSDELSNLDIIFKVNGTRIPLTTDFIPTKNGIKFNLSKYVNLYVWEKFDDSTSVSFVNSSLCTGVHQKVVTSFINEKIFGYENAHRYYEYFLEVNLPPKHVKFGDQNKTKFSSNSKTMNSVLKLKLTQAEVRKVKKTIFYDNMSDIILEAIQKGEIKKVKKAKKQKKIKISDKFYPPSRKKDKIFLTEGSSARGGLLQKRNPKTDGVYALRGKLKNVKSIDDLTTNQEIIDLMNILNLDLATKGEKCEYNKVIIAVDADPDGMGHISSLIINFFYNWFPKIIEKGKLYILRMPLASTGKSKKRKYYYTLSELRNSKTKENLRYLKGLGSNDIIDWEYIFNDMHLLRLRKDTNSKKYIKIAFGNDSLARKNWLKK